MKQPDAEILRLALQDAGDVLRLSGVPLDYFVEGCAAAIADACGNAVPVVRPSAADILGALTKAQDELEAAQWSLLAMVNPERGLSANDLAGHYLRPFADRRGIDEFIERAEKMRLAISLAIESAKKNTGQGGRPRWRFREFDTLCFSLWSASLGAGVRLTSHKDGGTFFELIEALRPALPKTEFWPDGDLRRYLERLTVGLR